MVSWQDYQWSLFETMTVPGLARRNGKSRLQSEFRFTRWLARKLLFDRLESEQAARKDERHNEERSGIMVAKRGKRTTKKVNSLKSKSLTAKEAKNVKGGTITFRPATINWGDGRASKVQGN